MLPHIRKIWDKIIATFPGYLNYYTQRDIRTTIQLGIEMFIIHWNYFLD